MTNCPKCTTMIEDAVELESSTGQALECGHCGYQWILVPKTIKSGALSGKIVRRIDLQPGRRKQNRHLAMAGCGEKPQPGTESAKKRLDGSLPPETEMTKSLLVKTGNPNEPEAPDRNHYNEIASSVKDKLLNMTAVVGALAIFGGVLMMRDQLISVIPDLNTLYKMAGIDIYQPALEFSSVRTRVGSNNRGVLVVEGLVKNTSARSLDIPAIQLEMRNADKRKVYSWIYEPKPGKIAAGEIISFSTKSVVPKAGARDVRLSFVSKSQPKAEIN